MIASTGTDLAEVPRLRMATLCIKPDQCATPMLVTRGVDSLLLAWPSPEPHGPAVDRFEVQRKLVLHSAPAGQSVVRLRLKTAVRVGIRV